MIQISQSISRTDEAYLNGWIICILLFSDLAQFDIGSNVRQDLQSFSSLGMDPRMSALDNQKKIFNTINSRTYHITINHEELFQTFLLDNRWSMNVSVFFPTYVTCQTRSNFPYTNS
jgi:hypothetical protein